jgi:hypothetical protein
VAERPLEETDKYDVLRPALASGRKALRATAGIKSHAPRSKPSKATFEISRLQRLCGSLHSLTIMEGRVASERHYDYESHPNTAVQTLDPDPLQRKVPVVGQATRR